MRRILILICLLLPACVANRTNTRLATWNGRTSTHLIERWGPPSRILPEGSDTIYVYTYDSAYTVQHPSTVINTGTARKPQALIIGGNATTYNYQSWYMFWVNPAGTIYKWSWGRR